MAAGQGFKTFATGDVLSAADVNGYLMQGVLVFADATERNAEITSPQEGQFAYLKDTNVTTYYTGSAWANLDTTGMTNPMTTTGDTIYSSSGSTPARLGIGTTGQVLTVSGGVPTWATPAAGGSSYSGASLSNNGTVTVASNTWTAIPYPQEEWDTDNYHSTSTNTSRFTIPSGKAGKFLVTATVDYEGYNGWANSRISIYKNGAQLKYVSQFANGTTGGGFGFTIAGIVDAVVGDYFEIYVWQNTGVSRLYYPGVTNSNCTWAYLGA